MAVIPPDAAAQMPEKKGISVAEPPADPSPEAELASFKVLDGFQVNLFASEADGIPNALAIRWDERGRLWCLQTSAYPQPAPGEAVDDKVVILEDTDRDGRADRSIVWARGLRMPMGMELAGPGELYVGEGEKLLLLTDTDGDDRADRKEVVFSGFGTGDTHQNLNSFIWAPDGCLIMHQGLHTYSRISTPWGVKQLYGSGFWRFWPRSRKLEAYPTGMPANAWGTAFDRWGQPIMVAGAAGMFWARPMEVAVGEKAAPKESAVNSSIDPGFGHHFLLTRFMLPHNGQIIKTAALRKFCGVDIAGNAHWPNTMDGEIVAGGFFENAVYRYRITDDRENPSGFEAVEQPPLITSTNVAFRPVDVRFGHDGALYVADWFNPIIGHYQASFRHPDRDKQHGRIWRITAKDRPPVPTAAIDPKSAGDCVTWHHSSDRWRSYQGQRLLGKALETGEDTSFVIRHEPGADPQRDKLGELQFQEMREVPDPDLVRKHLRDADPRVRAYATHALGNWLAEVPDAVTLLGTLIADESPRVRLEAIVAAAKAPHADAIRIALKALDKPMDTFLDRTLWLAVHATAREWKPHLQESPDAGVFLASLPPAHLAFLIEREGSTELLDAVRRWLADAATQIAPGTRRAVTAALVQRGDPADLVNALALALQDDALLESLAAAPLPRGFKPPEEAMSQVGRLLESGTPRQQAGAARLAAAWRLRAAEPAVRRLSGSTDVEVRTAALAALGKLGADAAVFEPLIIAADQPWPVRAAALAALADVKPVVAARLAAAVLPQIGDATLMAGWLRPVLARDAAAKAFATEIARQPPPVKTAELALAAITASGQSDAALAAALGKIVGIRLQQPAYDPQWVAALAAEVKAHGDSNRGREVFKAPLAGCVACHQINQIGGIIGPELDAVGRGVPLELLIEAVVWPSRQIKEGYVATTLTTIDGRRLQGYKVTEGNGEFQLKDMAAGTVTRIALNQIKERQEAGSLMPEGLILNMTREDLRDLIAFLAGLGR